MAARLFVTGYTASVSAELFKPDAVPHQKILAGIYLLIAAFLLGEIAVFWNQPIVALADYISGGGIAGYAAIGIAFTTPLSCLGIAYLVHTQSRSPWMALLAVHTIFVFLIAVLPAIYLCWCFWRGGRENGGRAG